MHGTVLPFLVCIAPTSAVRPSWSEWSTLMKSPGRTSKLKQIHGGHYQVLLATGQLFGEGMRIENIEALTLAFPFAFEGKLTQYLGRLMHSAEPKAPIDYHDKNILFLDRQFKKR